MFLTNYFTKRLRYILLQVTRPMIGRVMNGAKAWIEELRRLDNIGFQKAPDLQFMAEAILTELPELQAW